MNEIVQHLPAIITGLTGLISTLFFRKKYSKTKKVLDDFQSEHEFVVQQRKELYESFELINDLKQERILLKEKVSQLEIQYKNAEAEIEKLSS